MLGSILGWGFITFPTNKALGNDEISAESPEQITDDNSSELKADTDEKEAKRKKKEEKKKLKKEK